MFTMIIICVTQAVNITSPKQNIYYTDFSINRFSTKEAQTFSHNLTLCKFLLLATCFSFWKAIIRQLKVYIKYNPLKLYFFRQLRSEIYKKWSSTS